MRLPSLVNMLIGLWLIASPVVLGHDGAPAANDFVLGVTVICVALFSAVLLPAFTASSWVNVFCGIWLVFAPVILSYQELRVASSNDIGMGLLLAITASVRVCSRPRLTA